MFRKLLVFDGDCFSRPHALEDLVHVCASEVLRADSAECLLALADRYLPDCAIVLATREITASVLHLIGQLRAIDHSCPLLLISNVISTATAIAAMRSGAADLLDWTASRESVLSSFRSICSQHPHRSFSAEEGAEQKVTQERMVGSGATMSVVRRQIERAACSDATVLITGESGTGKEVAAELIHQRSARRHHHLVALNCAAIPDTLLESELFGHERGAFTGANSKREGKLQHASGGTLFLDEIGDMPPQAQAKILRAIENRVYQRLGSNVDTHVDARLIAATNQDLERLTSERKFRQDLYFRLNVVRIALPPLRERVEDIPELVDHVLTQLGSQRGEPTRCVNADVIRWMQRYHWPGNVRELRNVIESALVFSNARRIGIADMDIQTLRQLQGAPQARIDERGRIMGALNSADWNREKAADALQCSRMTLYRKMVKYSIQARPN